MPPCLVRGRAAALKRTSGEVRTAGAEKGKRDSQENPPPPLTAPVASQLTSAYGKQASAVLSSGDSLAFMLDIFNRENTQQRD
ncbi:MAG: hypothetical protein NT074_00410 [Methanomicrobiales archaeon]|nr:hypothetical protein [Methanomicrobiales archaeon]